MSRASGWRAGVASGIATPARAAPAAQAVRRANEAKRRTRLSAQVLGHVDHDLPASVARLEIAEGFGRPAQRIASVDNGLHRAVLYEGTQGLEVGRRECGHEAAEFLGSESGHDGRLDEQRI